MFDIIFSPGSDAIEQIDSKILNGTGMVFHDEIFVRHWLCILSFYLTMKHMTLKYHTKVDALDDDDFKNLIFSFTNVHF